MRIATTAAVLLCTFAASAQVVPITDSELVSQGWQLLLERNDHQYWLWDDDMEWEQARAMCESLGAYLYWPNDAEEHQAVWETVPHGDDGMHFWTAIHQDFNVVSCSDANGGWAGPNNELQSYFLWAVPGEPNNAGGKESVVQFEWEDDGISWNDAPGQDCDDGNNCDCRFSRVILERSIPIFCDDPESCNYIEGSLSNNGCDYSCCPGPGCCAEGMHWDWELGQCQNTLPGDTNGDGCVQLNDLLDVLSAYGNCGQSFPCGDLLSYQGYDYATVQIGGQCWFAENLRSENYRNGDAISAGLSDSDWYSTTSGAVTFYAESASLLSEYGRLYNWYAVDDSRGLCPSGWHVPTDGEWMAMEMGLGMTELEIDTIGWRGTDQGTQMKTTDKWSGGGNGTNSSGFSGLPGGFRYHEGDWYSQTFEGRWWSSTANGSQAWCRTLKHDNERVSRGYFEKQRGFSVRCIRDTE